MLVFHKQKWNIDLDPNNAKYEEHTAKQSKIKLIIWSLLSQSSLRASFIIDHFNFLLRYSI